jgi:uncharacterized membrane protein
VRSHLKQWFLTGLVVVVPISLTAYILWFIIHLMDGLLRVLPGGLHPNTYLPVEVPGLGAMLTVLLILVVGLLTRSFLGKKLVGRWEWVVGKIPMVRNIYQATKQLAEAVFVPKSQGFRKVVLVEFPRKGIYSVGFLTGVAEGEVQARTRERVVNVYVPTTPNPTTGFYILVPEGEVRPLEMTVEDAFKLIVSGGMIVPPAGKPAADAAADARDEARPAPFPLGSAGGAVR